MNVTDKERVEKFKSGKIAVNCFTEEEARQFIEWCYRNDIRWQHDYKTKTYFDVYKDRTCYRFDHKINRLFYLSKKFYAIEGFDVITYKEFMKADKNRVTNLDKYHDAFINAHKSIVCYFKNDIKNEKCPSDKSCNECREQFLKWALDEYKECIKLTQVQYEILKCLPQCSSILVKNNKINIHKDNLEYFLSKIGVQVIESDCDEKSIKIKDILENCEVVE